MTERKERRFQFWSVSDPSDGAAFRLHGARALFGRGRCLDHLGDRAGAVRAFNGLVLRYAGAGGPGVRRLVALGRVFLALVLTDLGREGAAATARDAVARPGDGPGAVLLWSWVVAAFGAEGGRYVEADLLTDDPAALCDRVVRCFGPHEHHPGLRALVAGARRCRPG